MSLSQDFVRKEIEFGAPEEKIEIIPNGVDVERFSNHTEHALAQDSSKFRVGLVGRVVPIKDIKTFIKSVRFIRDRVTQLLLKNLPTFLLFLYLLIMD